MKKVFLGLFFGILMTNLVFAQSSKEAKELLDEVSSTLSTYDNLSMDFDYVLDNQAEDVRQEMSGDLVIEGEKYLVNLFGSTQIFDGNNTYTIIPENEEINVSGVDIDGDNTFTPSKFYSFYKEGYTFANGEKKNIGGKTIQYVELTPIDSNSEVSSVLVGIDLKTKHIYQIVEIGHNQTRTILTASNIRFNRNLDEGLFKVDLKKYEDLNYIINN